MTILASYESTLFLINDCKQNITQLADNAHTVITGLWLHTLNLLKQNFASNKISLSLVTHFASGNSATHHLSIDQLSKVLLSIKQPCIKIHTIALDGNSWDSFFGS